MFLNNGDFTPPLPPVPRRVAAKKQANKENSGTPDIARPELSVLPGPKTAAWGKNEKRVLTTPNCAPPPDGTACKRERNYCWKWKLSSNKKCISIAI